MFPCQIVPTSSLLIGNNSGGGGGGGIRPASQPIAIIETPPHTRTTSSVSSSNRELDEKTGLAILAYLYESKSLFDDDTDIENDDELAYRRKPAVHDPVMSFFRLPEKNTRTEQRTLLERGKTLLKLYPRKENIQFITKGFLIKHGLTIRVLLVECEVEIANLWKAGIATTYEDLCDLGFQLRDLVINTSLFNVGHIVQLYKMDATSLNICVEDLLECRFVPSDLDTLQFSLPALIESNGIKARHIQLLGYSLSSLRMLGLRKSHLRMLGITMSIAINEMKWHPNEVSQMS